MPASVYESLGIDPIINCATTYTRLGGSTMAPHVAQAMADSADAFVDVFALQRAIGARLAAATNNDAAYVSNGAAAGIALAVAGAMTGEDPALMARLPLDTAGMKNEVVVHRVQRNWYDIAIRQVGARIIEIGHSLETQTMGTRRSDQRTHRRGGLFRRNPPEPKHVTVVICCRACARPRHPGYR